MMYYSASTNGFYTLDIHEVMPKDVVEISDDAYSALLSAQAVGKVISSDKSGYPIAMEPQGPSEEHLAQMLVSAALAALSASDITILRCYEAGIPAPVEWVAYRDHLRSIAKGSEQAVALPTKPAFPQTK